MFLVSNVAMVKVAIEQGATAAIPALNYRTISELESAVIELKTFGKGPFGINLIVNKSNPYLSAQLDLVCKHRVDFVITSLGNPHDVIRLCKPLGIKVFCDVVDVAYSLKVEQLGADAVVAVSSNAGGHAGTIPYNELLRSLTSAVSVPIISAGGVATYEHVQDRMALGAAGVSVGTIFIASVESPVSEEYKKALVMYGAKDIIMTSKLSGSPLTVINTPYVQSLGTKPTFWERLLIKNKWLKKYIKMLVMYKGMKAIEKAAFGATYKTVWCAGPVIEHIHSIRPMKEILNDLLVPTNKI